ncbi:hypothetical protein [Pararhizobium polonicum]|nr:hypothetical protein [Pararhizobium polonicum]
MSNHLEGDIISPPEASIGGVIRVERVWQHRHDLELRAAKARRGRAELLTLGAGGLMLSAICVFAYSELVPTHLVSKEAMASYPVGQEIAATSTKLRDIVDTTPAPVSISETQVVSLPFVAIPTKRPLNGLVKSEKVERAISATSSADVLRYDRCNPHCETRDSLVAGTVPVTVHAETAELDSPNRAVEIGASALNGAGYVLTQTAALPFTTLKLGRDAVIKVSELD